MMLWNYVQTITDKTNADKQITAFDITRKRSLVRIVKGKFDFGRAFNER